MEPQKSAASRVRHILQAMERSIDTARSRRVGSPSATSTAPAANIAPAPMAMTNHDRIANHATTGPTSASAIPTAKTHVPGTPAQMMIGAPAPAKPVQSPSMSPSASPQAPRDGQPPRLKAKPKRFDGTTFNSQFSAPPAYRSQTG